MARLRPSWRLLFAQVGAVPGGQAIEALFAAHSMINVVKVTDKNYVFVKMDPKGAFDNLSHASVGQDLASLPPNTAGEAERLFRLLTCGTLIFQFLQNENGSLAAPPAHYKVAATLRGFLPVHSTTSSKFLRLAGGLGGTYPRVDPLWMLLYVDDIMLCFDSWRQACALMPSFQSTLSSIGMKINLNKSCVLVNPFLLRTAAECTDSTLSTFQWCEATTYLNRPSGLEVTADMLCQQAVAKMFAAWGSLKSVLGRGDANGATQPALI